MVPLHRIKQGCGSGFIESGSGYGSRSSILSGYGSNPDPGFDVKKLKKINTGEKFFVLFFDQKLQFTYPLASLKDVKATGEAFSPQKRTSST
jgi:hypothetical protein